MHLGYTSQDRYFFEMTVRKSFCKFCVFLLVTVIGIDSDRSFIISPLHNGHFCPSSLDFGQALNELQCSALCEREPTCNSFVYNELHTGCRGSFNIYTDTRVCPYSTGAFYYKAGTYDDHI